jgi:secreted trypsin-like serine protease
LSCGVSGKPSGLIVNGTESKRGAWPWIATVYSIKGEQYLCGGTLIGLNLVATVSDN